MNPSFLTNLTSLLLACNTSFYTEFPNNVALMQFTLNKGQVQKHEINGGKEKISSVNVTCDEKLNGLTGIRLQPFVHNGTLLIGGHVERGDVACMVYGQEALMRFKLFDSAKSSRSSFFILAGKVYHNRCLDGKSVELTVRNLDGGGRQTIDEAAVPCTTPFGVNHYEHSIVYEENGECKQISSDDFTKVTGCSNYKVAKPGGMYETPFFSLRFLTIKYPECYSDVEVNGTELDEIHVKYLFRKPTTPMPITTTLPPKPDQSTDWVLIGICVSVSVVLCLVIGILIWKCWKRCYTRCKLLVKPGLPESKTQVDETPSEKLKRQEDEIKALKRILPKRDQKIEVDPEDDGLRSADVYDAISSPENFNPETIARKGDETPEWRKVGNENGEKTLSGIYKKYKWDDEDGLCYLKVYLKEEIDFARIEVGMLKKLNDRYEERERHHQTISYTATFQDDQGKKMAFIITDYWSDNIKVVERNMDMGEAFILGYHCLLGLHQLHVLGYAHLNVAPENFRCNEYYRRVALTELGLARRFGKQRHHRRERVFFASIGSHDGLAVSMVDDYHSWLLLVLNFLKDLPFRQGGGANDSEETWTVIREEKRVLMEKFGDAYGSLQGFKAVDELRNMCWQLGDGATVDHNAVVKHLELVATDNGFDLYKDPFKKLPVETRTSVINEPEPVRPKQSEKEEKKSDNPPAKDGKASVIKPASKMDKAEQKPEKDNKTSAVKPASKVDKGDEVKSNVSEITSMKKDKP